MILLSAQKTKTIITITHRLSSVKNYDLIYVLDKGNLVDQKKS